jgi:hypothetical protein
MCGRIQNTAHQNEQAPEDEDEDEKDDIPI